MATPHKSIFVPEDQKAEFDLYLESLLVKLGLNYSELSRRVVLDGEVLAQSDLSNYLSKEARKTAEAKYLIVKI